MRVKVNVCETPCILCNYMLFSIFLSINLVTLHYKMHADTFSYLFRCICKAQKPDINVCYSYYFFI